MLRQTTNRLFLQAVDGYRALIAEQEDGTDLAENSILSAVDVQSRTSQILVQGLDIDPALCMVPGGI